MSSEYAGFDSLVPAAPQVTTKKDWPVTGLPAHSKKITGIAELEHDEIAKAIEVIGARMAWARTAFCPCTPINEETAQPDPLCPRCQGRGFFHFGPAQYVPPADVGELTPLQNAILADDGACVIRGLFQRATNKQNPYDVVGNWVKGETYVTVRNENLLGWYDRLTLLDSSIVYTETVVQPAVDDQTGPIRTIPLRYRASYVNAIFTTDSRFEQGEHFELSIDGKVFWIIDPPTEETRYTVHYCTPPTWLVVEHPHVARETGRRQNVRNPKTPFGNPQPMPLQARVQLEFLPKRPDAP